MTETAAAAARQEPAQFIEAWSENLGGVLAQVSGSPVACSVLAAVAPETPPATELDQWIICACSGGLRGEMSLRLPPASAVRVAQILMGEASDPQAQLTAEHREAALELMRQVAGLVASVLQPRWGEVQLRLESNSGPPSWPAAASAWIGASGESASAVQPLLEIHLSAALAAALRAEHTEKRDELASAPGAIGTSSSTVRQTKPDLSILMDVGLAVTLRFGTRRLLLRDVLDLAPGAVIELDRQVQDPVDLVLDGRLLARGEIVVMDGNYALRVTQTL